MTGNKLRALWLAAIALITIGAFITPASASDTGENGQAAAYIKMGVGARPLGMGGAFAAIADDATATYWNPAGLVQLKSDEITTMHAVLNLDRNFNFVNYAKRLQDGSFWAFSWTHFGVDGIEERAGANDSRGYAAGDLISYFDDSENTYAGTYAWSIKPDVSCGVTFKYMDQSLADATAQSFGMDVGLLYRVNDQFSLATTLKDLASDMKWDTGSSHTDKIPWSARVGMVFKPRESLLLALDVDKTKDLDAQLHFGMEGWIREMFGLRAGVDDGDLTLGSTFKFEQWQVDYSFTDRNFGDEHRFSGRYMF